MTKSILLTLFVINCSIAIVSAQAEQDNKVIEAEIKRLEQMEVQAVLKKDTVTLLKLWDKDYVVNAPDNQINFAGKTTLDRPVLKRPRVSFTRNIEHIIIRGNTVFSMGSETVESQTNSQVKRRYTNIWMKRDGSWKMVARHANVICP
jgi:ketosteroid isomerase-like protein